MYKEEENIPISTTKKTSNRIMLVDEDSGLLIPVKLGLEYHNFIVDTFSNSLEALASFKPQLYDLVLLGVRMEKMNGFELCKEMQKKIANKCDVKFCFMTSFGPYREVLKEKYPELNDIRFIILPIAIADLVKIINEELDR